MMSSQHITQYAQQPIEQLTLGQMLDFGRDVTYKHDKILTSARYVHREVCYRMQKPL